MTEKTRPTTFTLDIIGANGTPFRFMYKLGGTVWYYDRRYTLQPDELGYHPNNCNEDGQKCGPDLMVNSFTGSVDHGIIGWHEVEAWYIDASTRRLVGTWLTMIKERSNREDATP